MATDFKTQLAEDMANVLLDPAVFGEFITYLPHQDEPRTIPAIVEREQVEPADAGPSATRFGRVRYRISIANHATKGIIEVTVGKDRVECKASHGDAQTTSFVVTSILNEDPGGWHLEITK